MRRLTHVRLPYCCENHIASSAHAQQWWIKVDHNQCIVDLGPMPEGTAMADDRGPARTRPIWVASHRAHVWHRLAREQLCLLERADTQSAQGVVVVRDKSTERRRSLSPWPEAALERV